MPNTCSTDQVSNRDQVRIVQNVDCKICAHICKHILRFKHMFTDSCTHHFCFCTKMVKCVHTCQDGTVQNLCSNETFGNRLIMNYPDFDFHPGTHFESCLLENRLQYEHTWWCKFMYLCKKCMLNPDVPAGRQRFCPQRGEQQHPRIRTSVSWYPSQSRARCIPCYPYIYMYVCMYVCMCKM